MLDAALLGKLVERLLSGDDAREGNDRITSIQFAAGAWNLSCIRLSTASNKTFVISITEEQPMPEASNG